ncbi:MAG TPA: ribonuclease HII [Vicinamibacterales bacterium]|nr:ribonuclease HII [Vicinamibacterales bacterium]
MTRARASRALENAARRFGIVHVAGVDEVGRGCLAGPVVAAAVILHPERYIPGVADSKLLPAETRERLSLEITAAAVAWHVCVIEPAEIDRLNIHKASLHCMHQAVMGLVPLPGLVLIDGFPIPQLVLAQRSLVGGDRRVSAIAAASIVAKVHRDRLMCELHERDPRYGFNRHKGYATADHLAAVDRCGYSDAHRRTFRPPTLFGPL